MGVSCPVVTGINSPVGDVCFLPSLWSIMRLETYSDDRRHTADSSVDNEERDNPEFVRQIFEDIDAGEAEIESERARRVNLLHEQASSRASDVRLERSASE